MNGSAKSAARNQLYHRPSGRVVRRSRLSTAKSVSSLLARGGPRWWPSNVLALSGSSAVFEPVAVAGGGDDVGVVAEPVEEAGAGCLVG